MSPWRLAWVPFVLLPLTVGCVDGCGYHLVPRIEAIAGEGGVALYVPGVGTEGASLEVADVAGGTRTLPLEDAGPLVDPEGIAGTVYTLIEGDGEVVDTAVAEALVLAPDVGARVLVDPDRTDAVALRFVDTGLYLMRGEVFVARQVAPGGERVYLDPTCGPGTMSGCWVAEPVAHVEGASVSDVAKETLYVDPFSPDLPVPAAVDTGLLFRVEDPVSGDAVLAGDATRRVLLETDLRWGDPHAHSNLSHDGCEDPDADCGHRGEGPGEDHFDNAVAAGLDFAAITDHGEWDTITAPAADAVDIWPATQQLVASAEAALGPDFVPLLGYEWTHFVPVFGVLDPGEDPDPYADEFTAGHKTVLLDGTAACDAYRVAAPTTDGTYDKGESGLLYAQTGVHPLADKAPMLFEKLDEAGQQCDAVGALTFFHHPATLLPNPVNWALPANEPDEHYERLVEIASEQGSAECRDITYDGCDFWINDVLGNVHVQWGSVQEALSQGYRLGFVGGTDGHDARPGSLDDGPSSLALYGDMDGDGTEDGPLQHPYPGAITGVWVQQDWSREALWEALSARRTLASTGPRGSVGAVALGHDGAVYLPGEVVPAGAFPLRVLCEHALDDDGDALIQLVEPDGGTVEQIGSGLPLDMAVGDPGGTALYLRVLLARGGVEHRIWISPWFIER